MAKDLIRVCLHDNGTVQYWRYNRETDDLEDTPMDCKDALTAMTSAQAQIEISCVNPKDNSIYELCCPKPMKQG